jgi:uncharacterized protein
VAPVIGPFSVLGQRIRLARERRGWSREKLARLVVMNRLLDVTLTGARFMVREIEDDGLAMNEAAVQYMAHLLDLSQVVRHDGDVPNNQVSFHPAVALVLDHFALPLSSIHGPCHWGRVLENGLRLAPLTGADPVVVSLFSIFHDSCRMNDGGDWGHGPRAAAWIKTIDLNITTRQRHLLIEAVEGHTQAFQSADATVGTCWDSDRLDIGRVGRVADKFYMSTKAACDRDLLAWAQDRAERGEVPPFVNLDDPADPNQ